MPVKSSQKSDSFKYSRPMARGIDVTVAAIIERDGRFLMVEERAGDAEGRGNAARGRELYAEKCVLCNRCVDICPEYCLKLVPIEELDLAPEITQKVIDSELGSLTGPLSAMLKDDEKCIRCGLCAIRCPTDAMTMEVFYYEEEEFRA